MLFLSDDVRNCLLLFFIGCGFIQVYDTIQHSWKKQFMAFSGLVLLWLFTVHTPTVLLPIYAKVTGRLELDIILMSLVCIMGFLLLFNAPIFDKVELKYFQLVGDMTYSTYMIHFPVQLAMFLVLKPADYTIFFDEKIFFAYLAIVIILGRVVYVFVEKPLKLKLRNISASVSVKTSTQQTLLERAEV